MKLAKMRVRNFRCFKDETEIDFDDLTALIGKNDAGKSSIMEALNIFLNDECPDRHDGTKHGEPKDLVITCEFEDLPSRVVIDEDYETSLADECLLNERGRLEIQKEYSGHTANPKCTGVFAIGVHPTAGDAADLLQLKNTELKKRARALGVDLTDVDQKVNAQLRAKIRSHVKDLKPTGVKIPLNEANAKSVWDGLKKYVPAFALFKADRQSTDQDPEAQDPLKMAVKEALKAKEKELGEIVGYVEEEVKKIANATLQKLQEMDPGLATQLKPEFSAPKWDSLFKASITGDGEIPINKRGSGVKRLILLNFFRAKAEQKLKESTKSCVIYGIEEPETSQHPNNQRMLMRALCDLSTEAQVVISTHTPMLARSLPDSNLRYIHIEDDKTRKILVGGRDTNATFAKALGVLPDNGVKLFIGVEGKHDISFLLGVSEMLRREGVDVPDLQKMELDGELIFFALGGSTLLIWTCRLKELHRPEFHLFDRDAAPPAPPKYKEAMDKINAREKCRARSTVKREMENHLHKDAIVAAYAANGMAITIPKKFGPFDDVPLGVARIVHCASKGPTAWDMLPEDKQGEKESKAKRVLNGLAVKHMNKVMLDEMDPGGDVLAWFKDMKDLIAAGEGP
jgi:energy-coupling factor transporter ATP-binding protein EcfA2